jgi:hypothetical protein
LACLVCSIGTHTRRTLAEAVYLIEGWARDEIARKLADMQKAAEGGLIPMRYNEEQEWKVTAETLQSPYLNPTNYSPAVERPS